MDILSAAPYYLTLASLAILTPVASLLAFVFTATVLKAHKEHKHVPSQLAWVGRRKEFMGSLRANIRGATDSLRLFVESYNLYSLKEKIVVVPTWTKGPQVLLPPSMIQWLVHQPTEIFNAKDCTFENMQLEYTFEHKAIVNNDMVELMIKRDLTRSVGTLNDVISDEILATFDEMLGNDSVQWREVGVWDTMIKVVARSGNRIFVGPEVCRINEYLDFSVKWAQDIQISGSILTLLPRFVKPGVAFFLNMYNRRDAARAMKHTIPLCQQRIDDMTRKLQDPTDDYEPPNDLLTWMVRESLKRTTESERSADSLAYRLLLINFAAVFTPTIAATNMILDILAAPTIQNVVPQLVEEASRVLAENDGVWTKAAVSKLYRLDSAIRESMRMSGIQGTGLGRRIKSKDGAVLPDGTWVPQGATVGVAQYGIHYDENNYHHPYEFDPFRFSRPREDAALDEGKSTKLVNEDMVTTSSSFIAFSHGIHACPGRFFGANQLKLIIAHLLLNYEIQSLPSRPPNVPLGDVMIPPVSAKMTLRRRVVKS